MLLWWYLYDQPWELGVQLVSLSVSHESWATQRDFSFWFYLFIYLFLCDIVPLLITCSSDVYCLSHCWHIEDNLSYLKETSNNYTIGFFEACMNK